MGRPRSGRGLIWLVKQTPATASSTDQTSLPADERGAAPIDDAGASVAQQLAKVRTRRTNSPTFATKEEADAWAAARREAKKANR